MCVLLPGRSIQYNEYDIDTVPFEHRITHHLLYLRKFTLEKRKEEFPCRRIRPA